MAKSVAKACGSSCFLIARVDSLQVSLMCVLQLNTMYANSANFVYNKVNWHNIP